MTANVDYVAESFPMNRAAPGNDFEGTDHVLGHVEFVHKLLNVFNIIAVWLFQDVLEMS